MGLSEFLDVFGSGQTFSEDDLTGLTGISNEEAAELAAVLRGVSSERVRDLYERLAEVALEDAEYEFDRVFKLGLEHSAASVRASALHGLGDSLDPGVVTRVVHLMERDPDPGVQAAAATTVAGICSMVADGRLSARMRDRVYGALLRVLESPETPSELWRRALEAAGAFPDDRVNGLIERAWSDPSPDMRCSVLIAVARTSDSRWTDVTARELDHRDAAVRFEAVNALGEIAGEMDADYLEGPLDDEDLMVQLAVVAAVEKLGGDGAKQLLRQALASPEPSVAKAADVALETIARDEDLAQAATPAMAADGLFGGAASQASREDVPYDAGEREGWGHIGEDGTSFQASDTVQDDDDDPLTPLMDYEPLPGQSEDED